MDQSGEVVMSYSYEAVVGVGCTVEDFCKIMDVDYDDIWDHVHFHEKVRAIIPYDGADYDEMLVILPLDFIGYLGWCDCNVNDFSSSRIDELFDIWYGLHRMFDKKIVGLKMGMSRL